MESRDTAGRVKDEIEGEKTEEENEGQDLSLLIGDREDITSILDWQVRRYHHLQTLSRGVFGTLIALIAVLLSAYVAFSGEVGKIPTNEATMRGVANELPIGTIAVNLTLALNLFIFMGLLILATFSLSIAFIRLFDVFTTRHLPPKTIFDGEPILFPKEKQTAPTKIGVTKPASECFRQMIHENQTKLEHTYNQFLEGSVRILTFLAYIFSGTFIYYHSANLEMTMVLWYNVILVLPASFTTRFLGRFITNEVSEPKEDRDKSKEPNLVRELLRETGRLSEIEFHPIENWFVNRISNISILVLSIWLLSLLYNFLL